MRAPRLMAVAGALLLLGGGAIAVVKRGSLEPGAAVEDRVALDLRDRLLRWRAPDGKGFGTAFDMTQSDAWSTAEAAAALAALGESRDASIAAVLAKYLFEAGVRRPPQEAQRGWRRAPAHVVEQPEGEPVLAGWGVAPTDTLASGEPTGYAGAGLGLLRARYGVPSEAECKKVAALILSHQNPDGSFATIIGMPETARASAVGDNLFALIFLDGPSAQHEPAVVAAVERTCEFIGTSFDPKAKCWPVRKARGAWGQGHAIGGLNEHYAWLLLEAEDYLVDSGRALPRSAKDALLAYANAFQPDHERALDVLPAGDKDDYTFEIPSKEKTTWGGWGHKWSWTTWRFLTAERLARMPGNPKAKEWAEEAEHLRARLPDLPPALEKAFPFHIAECLLMVAILREAPPGDPDRGGLYRRARRWRGGT